VAVNFVTAFILHRSSPPSTVGLLFPLIESRAINGAAPLNARPDRRSAALP